MRVNSDPLAFINDRVSPEILIQGNPTISGKRFSTNLYLDPEDSSRFDPEELTPAEKGHAYQYLQVGYQLFHIHLPYRIMDKEASLLVRNLTSFRSIKSTVRVHKLDSESKKKVNSCLQDFKLSKRDFVIFDNRCEKHNYLLENRSVSIQTLDALKNTLEDSCKQAESCIKFSREQAPECETLGDTDRILERLGEAGRHIHNALCLKKRIVDGVELLKEEYGRLEDKSLLPLLISSVDKLTSDLLDLDLKTITAECVHEATVGTSLEVSKPSYLGSLKQELDKLTKYFPSLRHLNTTFDDQLVLNLSGVTISMSPEQIKISGDIACLKPYTSGVSVKEKQKTSRFSQLFFQAETEEDAETT